MNKISKTSANYGDTLRQYYGALKSQSGLSGDLIWSSAVMMVVDALPAEERERRFVEISLAGDGGVSTLKTESTYKVAA